MENFICKIQNSIVVYKKVENRYFISLRFLLSVVIYYEKKILISVCTFFSGIYQFGANMFTFFNRPKCSSGQVEYSFDNPFENFASKPDNLLLKVRKKMTNCIKNLNFPNDVSGHIKFSYYNSASKFH